MAIDPTQITTVQASELPPASPTNESILMHQVGDILSRMTLAEIIAFISSNANSKQYEIKYIRSPNPAYITDNFDMTPGENQGIGKIDGLWDGWAICNGNNGTDNLDGQTLIGFGANYGTVGEFTGAKTVTLSKDQMPAHTHHKEGSVFNAFVANSAAFGNNSSSNNGYDSGNATELAIGNLGTNYGAAGSALEQSSGGGQAHNNMQPSMTILIIMKL